MVHDTRGRTSWEVLVYPISAEACCAVQTVHLLPDTGEMQERLEGRGLLVVRSPLPWLGFSGAHPLKGKLRVGRPVDRLLQLRFQKTLTISLPFREAGCPSGDLEMACVKGEKQLLLHQLLRSQSALLGRQYPRRSPCQPHHLARGCLCWCL